MVRPTAALRLFKSASIWASWMLSILGACVYVDVGSCVDLVPCIGYIYKVLMESARRGIKVFKLPPAMG